MTASTVTAERTTDEFGNSFFGPVDVSVLPSGSRVEIGRAPNSTVAICQGQPFEGETRVLRNEETGETLVIEPERIGMGRILDIGSVAERKAVKRVLLAYDIGGVLNDELSAAIERLALVFDLSDIEEVEEA